MPKPKSRYDALRDQELEILKGEFPKAIERILAYRLINPVDKAEWGHYQDGSRRERVDTNGGYSGFDRRIWWLDFHGEDTYVAERARHGPGYSIIDQGTFSLAISDRKEPMHNRQDKYIRTIKLEVVDGWTLDRIMLTSEALQRLYTDAYFQKLAQKK